MASTLHAAIGAAIALLAWTGLGLVLTRRLLPAPLAVAFAPVTGWAVHSAVALPAFSFLRLTATNAAIVFALVALVALAATRLTKQTGTQFEDTAANVSPWVFAAAALLALVPALAVLPHPEGDAVELAAPVFDHAKIAMIDDMAKFGVPAGNPFFAGAPLVYYYLWHFGAAELSVAAGITGWEADAALTWFSAAASLAVMIGLAAWWGGRTAASLAVILSAAASGREVLWWIFGAENFDAIVARAAGFGGWLFQVAYAPHHVMAAACVSIAMVLMGRLAAQPSARHAAVLGLLAAAAFGCSTWIGGLVFALAAPVVALVLLAAAEPERRWPFVAALAGAAVVAAALAAPLLRDQIAAGLARVGGPPIALQFYPVFEEGLSDRLRAILDPPGFWLVLLPLELPAIYAAGMAGLAGLVMARKLAPEAHRGATVLAALAAVCLLISWLLASMIGDNNDLGWRALLPAVMVLTASAAAGMVRWFDGGARAASAAAGIAVLLAVPGSINLIRSDVAPEPRPGGKLFAESPALWAAVRRHAAAGERVGNNPHFLAELTPWPINISWALLADRRSCFAGRELAIISPSLPAERREQIHAQFVRVFAGDGTLADIDALATNYDCRVIVVTPSDGAWVRDPFAASPRYLRVEDEPGRWRIYRATEK